MKARSYIEISCGDVEFHNSESWEWTISSNLENEIGAYSEITWEGDDFGGGVYGGDRRDQRRKDGEASWLSEESESTW